MAWYNASWVHRKKITVDHTKVASALSNFPVYLKLADLGADFFSNVESDGKDIRITRSDGTTECPFEIVAINAAGKTGELHFKANSLSNTTNTDFYIYYKNPAATAYAATDTYGRNAVWNDYWGVWHMAGAVASTAKKLDSTGNGRALTEGNTPGTSTDNWGTANGAYDYLGLADPTSVTTTYGFCYAPSVFSAVSTNPCTFSLWFRPHQTPSATFSIMKEEQNHPNGKPYIGFLMDATNKMTFGYGPTTLTSYATGTSAAMNLNEWHHVVGRRMTSTYYPSVTVDGTTTDGATGANTNFEAANSVFYVNRRYNTIYTNSLRYCDGDFSEMRVRISDVGTDWIGAEYVNQSAPATFYIIGSQEPEASSVKRRSPSGGAAYGSPAMY